MNRIGLLATWPGRIGAVVLVAAIVGGGNALTNLFGGQGGFGGGGRGASPSPSPTR